MKNNLQIIINNITNSNLKQAFNIHQYLNYYLSLIHLNHSCSVETYQVLIPLQPEKLKLV